MNSFYTIWLGQLCSTFGSQMTTFALGLWLYQKTGSATVYSTFLFCAILPSVLLSPFLGALVDRFSRKSAMLIADLGAGFSTAFIAILLYFDVFELWHLFVLSSTNAIFTTLQWPAYTAATSLLVPKDKQGQASGLVQLSLGIAQLLAPAIGGGLILVVGLEGIIAIDFLTFVVAVLTLLRVQFPAVPVSAEGLAAKGPLFKEAMFGFLYLKQRPGLWWLLWFLSCINFFTGVAFAIASPAILLSFHQDTVLLGIILSVGGLGMLVGGICMSLWGGPKRQMDGVLGFTLFIAMGMLLSGLAPVHPALQGAYVFIMLLGGPLVAACNQTIWQKKVPYDIQGKVFGVRKALATSTTPLAYLLAGPCVDYVFEPLMSSGAALAQSLSFIVGDTPGAGFRVMFLLSGLMLFLIVFIAWRCDSLRDVERLVPDIEDVSEPSRLATVG